MRRRLVPLILLVLAAAAVGCGGDDGKSDRKRGDPEPDNPHFHIKADARPFAGPVPLAVEFKADAFNAAGDVRWRWKFDDGTTSDEQSPTHTFKRAGYYYVTLRARDDETLAPQNFLLGAWPKKVWSAASEPGPIDPKNIRARIRDQHRRTAQRRRELRSARRQASE